MPAEFALLNCGEDWQTDKGFGVALAITNTVIMRGIAQWLSIVEGAMSAPTTKQQLLEQVQQEREQWEGLLAEIGLERMEVPGVTDDWTMKDTIAHMTTWCRREVGLLAAAQRGERPPDHPPQTQVPIINE